MDFVVLDFDADLTILFILGLPFLATEKYLIYVATGKMTITAYEKVKSFYVYKAMKSPAIYEEFFAITIVNLEFTCHLLVSNNPLEQVLMGCDLYSDVEALKMVKIMDLALIYNRFTEFELLNRQIGPPPKAFIDEAPKLKHKAVLPHLNMFFLVIIILCQ